MKNHIKNVLITLLLCSSYFLNAQLISTPTLVELTNPVELSYDVNGSLLKRLEINLTTTAFYAYISIYANDKLILDNIDVPNSGTHTLRPMVKFDATGTYQIKLVAKEGDITVNEITVMDINNLDFPVYEDITDAAGLISDVTYKYGGPTIADIDNDGDYDFILNNHNIKPAQLIWNNGDGTVTEYADPIAMWDLHGSAAGDYDNDGDLDLVITQGGGNGTTPQPPNFLRNDDGNFVSAAFDVGIDQGARGRGARWIDMDLDGDLDLAFFNAQGINSSTGAIHIFYENMGDGSFEFKSVPGLESKIGERMLVTDIDNDYIDDIILYWPFSVWKGNGDFTFTQVGTSALPLGINNLSEVSAVTDIDIDNDGDLDLYLAREKSYLQSVNPSLDFDPVKEKLDIRGNGNAGTTSMDFTAADTVKFFELDLIFRGYNGDFPVFLGSDKTAFDLDDVDTLSIIPSAADGWSSERTENGIYIGHIGNGEWKLEWKRNAAIYWLISFSMEGVNTISKTWDPQNRNAQDVLLRNDGGVFTDVSDEWNIPKGGKNMGVTTGDFNNDGHADLYVYRYGYIKSPVADYLLLNNGAGSFEVTTTHDIHDVLDTGHGDMGQAFDFDLDGDLEFLNGSEKFGKWYLYSNENPGSGNYALVRVNYAPISNVDPISAVVTVFTPNNEYTKRVGSAGEIFSQSLLNTVHFGLGSETQIDSVHIRWRDGETIVIKDLAVNELIDSDNVPALSIDVNPPTIEVRENKWKLLTADILPINSNMNLTWTSSNDAAVSVDANGVVTGHLLGETATVTATTENGLADSSIVTVVEWFPIFVQSIDVNPNTVDVIEEDSFQLTSTILPIDADTMDVTWTSSDNSIATVDSNGEVKAILEGIATITATTVEGGLQDNAIINVLPRISTFIEFDDESIYLTSIYDTGGTLDVTCNYHAGTTHEVVHGGNAGIKYWLRELDSNWAVVNDYIAFDFDALGTESGTSSASISLADATPTADLAAGNFYFLWVTMASSNGETVDKSLVNINIEMSTPVENIDSEDITVYPIPTSDYLYLSGLEEQNYEVQIFDLDGKILLEQKVENGLISVDTLPNGTYVLRIHNEKSSQIYKIIKMK